MLQSEFYFELFNKIMEEKLNDYFFPLHYFYNKKVSKYFTIFIEYVQRFTKLLFIKYLSQQMNYGLASKMNFFSKRFYISVLIKEASSIQIEARNEYANSDSIPNSLSPTPCRVSPETGRFSPSERDQSPCLAETSPPPPHSSPSSLMTGSPGSPQLLLRPVPLHPSTSPSSSPLDLTSPARSYNMGMISPVPLSTLMQQPLRPAEIPASVQYPLGIPGRGKFIASMFRVK